MDFGISIFPTDEATPPDRWARMVEERGFESLFFAEHTHIPASRETPYPAGGELPREYSRIMDPFVALMAAATATEKLKVGTGLCLVIERDPIITAKEVASLDYISGGRFLFGVGAGWTLEEMRNHGTDPERRFGIMRERVEAMKAIWTEDEASYDGRHVNFDRIWSWPKPAQKPHPPVLVGGNGKTVYDRVLAIGDGWIPNWLGDTEKLAQRVERLQGLAADAGRDPLPVTVYNMVPDPAGIERLEQAGVTRVLFYFQRQTPDEAEERLDRRAEVIREYNGSS